MSIEDKDHSQAYGDEVDHAGSDTILNFFKACGGKAKPVIIRNDMVSAALVSEEAFNALPAIYQMGIQHADRWMEEFDGQDHDTQCVACGEHIHCEGANHHTEVGAMACIFKSDLDLTIGGLVFAICGKCAQYSDSELYVKIVEGLGGTKDDVVTPSTAKEPSSEHRAILKAMGDATAGAWAEYNETGDIHAYLKRGLDALNVALAAAIALRPTVDGTTAENTETQPKPVAQPVSQEDVNLLVGEG